MENSTSTEPVNARRFTPTALAIVLEQELRLARDTPLVVAYSGGMDSHVLLHALVALRQSHGRRVRAIHVDHNLQPAAADWAAHCAAVCAALAVPLTVERVTVTDIARDGLEQAARRARYRALRRQLAAGEVLLTAHHRDDQAETLLLQLLRGTGVRGLAGMAPLTERSGYRVARPLLRWGRAALAEYARSMALECIDDPSNGDPALARNFLRHRIIPALASRWPEVQEQLARSARHTLEATALLDEVATIDQASCATADGGLSITALQLLSSARRSNVIRFWLRQRTRLPAEPVLRQVLRQIDCPSVTARAQVAWPEGEVRRYRDQLTFATATTVAEAEWAADWHPSVPLPLPGDGYRLCVKHARGAGLKRLHLESAPWRVQWRRGGERCLLPGRAHRHKLKKLLQAAGIPPWERERLPLVYIDGELAAIADRWVCAPFAAQADEPGVVLVVEPTPPVNSSSA